MRLSETEPPTKEHTQAGPRPVHIYVADVQLGLHVGPVQLKQDYPKSCCLSVGYVLLAGLPCLATVGEDVQRLDVPGWGQGWGRVVPREGLNPLTGGL